MFDIMNVDGVKEVFRRNKEIRRNKETLEPGFDP